MIYKQLQGGGLQSSDLAGSVLHETRAWAPLSSVCGGRDGLSTQGDPVNGAVFRLFAPLLHWVLGTKAAIIRAENMHRHTHCIYRRMFQVTTLVSEVDTRKGKNSKPSQPNTQMILQKNEHHKKPHWSHMNHSNYIIFVYSHNQVYYQCANKLC